MYKRRTDGIYVIDLEKTYEKLQMAARVIVAIENPQVRQGTVWTQAWEQRCGYVRGAARPTSRWPLGDHLLPGVHCRAVKRAQLVAGVFSVAVRTGDG